MSWVQLIAPDTSASAPPGYCLGMATQVFFGAAWGYETATEAWEASPTKNGSREMPPVAVPCHFQWIGDLGYGVFDYGHIVVWIPGQGFLSSPSLDVCARGQAGQQWFGSIDEIERTFGCTYRGYTLDIMPNGTVAAWNGDTPPVTSLTGTQRQANPDGANRRSGPSSQSEAIEPPLLGGEVGNFIGWIHGEDPYGNGNDVWFQGISGNYFYSGAFTDSGTHDLADLNPAPAPTPVEPEVAPVPAEPTPVEPEQPIEPTKETPVADEVTTPPAGSARQNITKEQWDAIIAKADAGNDSEEVAKYDLVSKEFWNYAGERVIKTFFMSFSGMLVTAGAVAVTVPGVTNVLTEIGWQYIVTSSVVSALYSLGVALSGFKNIITFKK